MKKNSWIWLALTIACLLVAAPQTSFAKDDFGRIVHHIEAQYHVHRQHRLAIGFAGLVLKFYHFAGVKSLKGAIFDNQPFVNAGADNKLDEIVRSVMDSGWQPMVQSWDRRSGERTYVYAQEVPSRKGNDMKVLVINLESDGAVVLQVKVDPLKLNDFIEQTSAGHNRHKYSAPDENPQPENEHAVEAAASVPQDWDGVCLLVEDPGLQLDRR